MKNAVSQLGIHCRLVFSAVLQWNPLERAYLASMMQTPSQKELGVWARFITVLAGDSEDGNTESIVGEQGQIFTLS